MKTHTKPALIPGQIIFLPSGGNIIQTTIERSTTGPEWTEYFLTGFIGAYRVERLHTTFESALNWLD